MYIEFRHDAQYHQLSSKKPGLIGAWLEEMVSEVISSWSPATYVSLKVRPSTETEYAYMKPIEITLVPDEWRRLAAVCSDVAVKIEKTLRRQAL